MTDSELIRAVNEVRYQAQHPWLVDHSKYKRAFGGGTTPHHDAIDKTLEWFRQNSASRS